MADAQTIRQLVENDRLLDALAAVRDLPEDDPVRRDVEALSAHAADPEAYRKFYAETMRGEACDERTIFYRHEQIPRFKPIRQAILEAKAQTVLELGCLDGWQLLNLCGAGAIAGVGIDLNPDAIAVATERAERFGFAPRAQFFCQSIEETNLFRAAEGQDDVPMRFDAVILSEVLEHVLDPVACLRVAARHLTRNGRVYISVPVSPVPYNGKLDDAVQHLRTFSPESLREACASAGLGAVDLLVETAGEDNGQPLRNAMLVVRPSRVGVVCNYVTGGWDPTDLSGLNGSEELVVRSAERWAEAGCRVTVWQNGAERSADWANGELEHRGVRYRPREENPLPEPLDVLFLFKTLDRAESQATRKVFWSADPPGDGAAFLPPRIAATLAGVICISDWHRDRVLAACPWVNPASTLRLSLGVDPEEITSVHGVAKAPGRCVYASSLDRGLRPLLEMWPEIRERVPHAELRVLYGWDFWLRSEAVVPAAVRDAMVVERRALEKMLKQPGVTFVGRTSRADYLREMAEAEAWLYPCTGGELCCKVALEAQALGAVPVVWPTMALAETVALDFHVGGREAFVERAVAVLQNPTAFSAAVLEAGQRSRSWSEMADSAMVLATAKEKPEPELPAWARYEPPAGDFPIPSRGSREWRALEIVLAVPGMPFVGDTDRETSLGGSETAGLQLARELARRGHHVTVFSNFPEGKAPGRYDGVAYLPMGEFLRYIGGITCDVYIVQRDFRLASVPVRAGMTILWTHDLALSRFGPQSRSGLWGVDYVTPVSHWHGKQVCQVYGTDPRIIVPMRNGIDLETIRRCAKGEKDPHAVFYASRPERGLGLLLDKVFPRLLERDPKLTLYVAGYDNTTDDMRAFYDYCKERITQYGNRARWLGHLAKPELYELEARCRAYLYPTEGFEEVNCITAAECAATGLPFVASDLGALRETTGLCPGFAELVPHPGTATDRYVSDFVDAAWRVIGDDEVNRRMSQAGRAGADAYAWQTVGDGWEDFLFGALYQRSANAGRRLAHHWRTGDTFGALAMLAHETDGTGEAEHQMAREAPVNPDAVLEEVFNLAPAKPGPMPPEAAQVLAEKCELPENGTVLGLGPHGEANASLVAQRIAARTGRATSVVSEGPADLVVAFETANCTEDPGKHIAEIEAACGRGGMAVLAAPTPGAALHRKMPGGWWELGHHDLRDLVGDRKGLLRHTLGANGVSAYDGHPLSWQVYLWRPSATALRSVRGLDMDRRAALTIPRLTVSVCMLAHNEEGLLHRCLKSVAPHADEIIVGNDSSTDSTVEIARHYGAEVFDIPSPVGLEGVGFDEARNLTIARARGDLVLWIDADEELLDGTHFPKYRRWNGYMGYSVQQHHFSAVPPGAFQKPDLPVRVFRRTWLDGSPTAIRFWGSVHEHPEILPNHSVGLSVTLSDVHLAHDGYLTERIRHARFHRNIPLMFRERSKNPERKLGKFLMVRDWVHLGRYETDSHGGQLTVAAREYLEAAILLFREEFMGSRTMFGTDGMAYYHEALTRLGRGKDVQITIRAGGIYGPDEIAYNGRIENQADLNKLLAGQTDALCRDWEGRYL